jgi:MOSC domain-containing protein YiiM
MVARVVSVNIAVVRAGGWTGDWGRTGIDKRPVPGRVKAGRLGLTGDSIIDTRFHGGVDQAIYAYSQEDAAWWTRELDRDAPPGYFGENLTTEGIELTDAVIGERWTVGGTVLQVCSPRLPCRVFAGFWDVPDLIVRFTERAHPGAYLRVLEEGELGAGDDIAVTHQPGHGVTIGEVFRALTTEPALLPRLLEAPELPTQQADRARRRLGVQPVEPGTRA